MTDIVHRPSEASDQEHMEATLVAVLQLRTELARTRRTLEQREAILTALNRRLLALESRVPPLASDPAAGERARAEQALHEAAELRAELERMRATKLFRYARPLRKMYSVWRRL